MKAGGVAAILGTDSYLAEATLGVEQVRDLLEVPLPKEPASAP